MEHPSPPLSWSNAAKEKVLALEFVKTGSVTALLKTQLHSNFNLIPSQKSVYLQNIIIMAPSTLYVWKKISIIYFSSIKLI